jgi:hypothetical protein
MHKKLDGIWDCPGSGRALTSDRRQGKESDEATKTAQQTSSKTDIISFLLFLF